MSGSSLNTLLRYVRWRTAIVASMEGKIAEHRQHSMVTGGVGTDHVRGYQVDHNRFVNENHPDYDRHQQLQDFDLNSANFLSE